MLEIKSERLRVLGVPVYNYLRHPLNMLELTYRITDHTQPYC